jgi:hypothetical protein
MERLAAMGVLGACTWEFPAPGRCRGACTCRRAGRRAERRGAGRPWPERRASRLRGSPRLPRRGSSHGGQLGDGALVSAGRRARAWGSRSTLRANERAERALSAML